MPVTLTVGPTIGPERYTMHTVHEDFEHFLSYSGLRKEPQSVIDKMRMAFEAAWEPAAQHRVNPTVLCTCLYEVGGNDMSLNPDCPVHGSHSG